MVNYQCPRCGYETNIKTILKNHLNRKFICEPKKSNITIKEIYEKFFNNESEKQNNDVYISYTSGNQNVYTPSSFGIQNVYIPSSFQEKDDKNLINNDSICKYCAKKLASRQSRWRHEKTCKIKKEQDELKDKVEEQGKIIEKLLEEKKTTGKYSNLLLENKNQSLEDNKTSQSEFKVNPFSKTDRSHLKDSDYLMAIKKGNLGLAHIIQKLHFNEDKPENHNICMTNMKNNLVKVLTEEGWEYQLGNEVVNFLVEDNANIIEDKIAEWQYIESDTEEDLDQPKKKKEPKHKYGKKKYKTILEKFPRLLDRLSKSGYVQKLVHDQVKLVLYNKRRFALDAEKKMEKLKKSPL